MNGIEKHTVFRAMLGEAIAVFVNVNNDSNTETSQRIDIWEKFELMKTLSNIIDEKVYKATGEKITDKKMEKRTFCGQHAIRTTYTSISKSDFSKSSIRLYCCKYNYVTNFGLYTVAVKMPVEVYEICGWDGISEILSGYGISVAYR